MDTSQITTMLREGIWIVLKLGGPMLLLSMVVGILIAIFQAVTQIHEQTLAFIMKLSVVIIVLLVGGMDDGHPAGLHQESFRADGYSLRGGWLWIGPH